MSRELWRLVKRGSPSTTRLNGPLSPIPVTPGMGATQPAVPHSEVDLTSVFQNRTLSPYVRTFFTSPLLDPTCQAANQYDILYPQCHLGNTGNCSPETLSNVFLVSIEMIMTLFWSTVLLMWHNMGLPQWLSSKEFTCNAGCMGSIPGWGRSREGK